MSYALIMMVLVYVLLLACLRTWTCDLMTCVGALSSIDMSFLLILIPFEEPPHLTAGFGQLVFQLIHVVLLVLHQSQSFGYIHF